MLCNALYKRIYDFSKICQAVWEIYFAWNKKSIMSYSQCLALLESAWQEEQQQSDTLPTNPNQSDIY